MVIFITLGCIAGCAVMIAKKKVCSAHTESACTLTPPSDRQKIAQINTLLHNIEVYDGTSKGQKPLTGGDLL